MRTKDAIETYLRLDQARAARDGLSRMLYGRHFASGAQDLLVPQKLMVYGER